MTHHQSALSTLIREVLADPDLAHQDVFLDATYLGLRVRGRVVARAVVVATGVSGEGRIVAPDTWCRRSGAKGLARDTVTRRLAHVPFGRRATTLLVRVRHYKCSECGHVWRHTRRNLLTGKQNGWTRCSPTTTTSQSRPPGHLPDDGVLLPAARPGNRETNDADPSRHAQPRCPHRASRAGDPRTGPETPSYKYPGLLRPARHLPRPHLGHQRTPRTPPRHPPRLFRNLTNYIARPFLETGGFRPRFTP